MRRLLICLVVIPVLFLIFSPSTLSVDEALTFTNFQHLGNRKTDALKQVDAINAGRYLTDADGRSMIRTYPDDTGEFVWLADIGLMRRALGLGAMRKAEIFRAQAYVAVIGALLLVMCRVSFRTLVPAFLLLFFFSLPVIAKWGGRAWPQLLAVVTTFVLLDLSANKSGDGRLKNELWRLFLIALYAGWLRSFRAEAGYIVGLPFLLLLALNLVVVARDRITRERTRHPKDSATALALAKRWVALPAKWLRARQLPRIDTRLAGVRELVACAVILGGLTAASLGFYFNIKLFEVIEGVDHQPTLNGHLVWHPLYVGLGYQYHYPESISWKDDYGSLLAQKENGSFSGWGPESEDAARKRYLEIMIRNTGWVLQVYLSKLRMVLFDTAKGATFPLLIAALAALNGLLILHRLTGGGLAGGLQFIVASIAMIAAASMPAIATTPQYETAVDSALSGIVLFGLARGMGELIERDEGKARDESYWAGFRLAAGSFGIAICALLTLGVARAAWTESHRRDLTTALASEEIEYTQLLDEYHADAVVAFNRLSDAEREELSLKISDRYGRGLSPQLAFAKDPTAYSLINATWTDEYLFLLVRLAKPVLGQHVIPIGFKFRNLESRYLVDRIHLPPLMKARVWLFSMKAPRETVEALSIGDIVRFGGKHERRVISGARG